MCGRYTLSRRQQEIAERFGIKQILLDVEPRFNIAPTQEVPVILETPEGRSLVGMKWGLIPFWVKDIKKTKPFINARAETLAEKPSFKQNLARRRCLVPADGFYEWRKEGKAKIPMHIHRPDKALIAFAGLWDEWKSPEGEKLRTFTIVTTECNDVVRPVHDRMPVILDGGKEELWLDAKQQATDELLKLLAPYPNEKTEMFEVSTRVNSVAMDTPDLMEEFVVRQQSLGLDLR